MTQFVPWWIHPELYDDGRWHVICDHCAPDSQVAVYESHDMARRAAREHWHWHEEVDAP